MKSFADDAGSAGILPADLSEPEAVATGSQVKSCLYREQTGADSSPAGVAVATGKPRASANGAVARP
jgi:hypothetical protein